MKKRFWFLATAILMAVSFVHVVPTQASAASAAVGMWVEPTEENGVPARIDVFRMKTRRGYTYQVYLPGDADLSSCFLSWEGDMQAAVDGVSYDCGTCPVPPLNTQKTYTFRNGSRTLSSVEVITYQGSADVQRVFIEIDEREGNPTVAQMDGDREHETACTGIININGAWYKLTRMKGRGNATWDLAQDKRPYNITLGVKINFPGIDSDKTKKWTLLAEVADHSLLCNRTGFYLANELGVGYDTTSADVWLNGEYQGCYTVAPRMDAFVTDDGFMLEQDNYTEPAVAQGGDPQFALQDLTGTTGRDSMITVKKMGDNLLMREGVPDESPENRQTAAREIENWMQDAWEAICSQSGYNSKGKYYTEYIDMESFARMYLLHEYVKSYDICAGSILFHRDGQTQDDKLIAGPVWDLDNALGATSRNPFLGSADDRVNGDRRSGEGLFISNVAGYWTPIYKTLGTHEDFMQEVYRQYSLHREVFDGLPDAVAQMIDEIGASAEMNHIKVSEIRYNNHKYERNTTLGSEEYRQTYLATTNSKTDWNRYAANLKTFVTARSLWFTDTYCDPNSAGLPAVRMRV